MADTQLNQLVINELTKAQYEALTPEANQLYLITDEVPLDVSNISTSITSSSTNNQVAGAKAVYDYHDNTKLDIDDIIDNTTTTTTNQALSANQGKVLNDRIEALKARGRYLSIWNATTGLPTTNPQDNPYDYKTGDYFIVGMVGTTNYKPTGTQYTRTASTTVETNTISVNDTYYYDGNGTWNLIHTEQQTVAFSTLAGDPYDNTNLTTALNAKVTGNNSITGATKTKITYDSKGLVTAGSDLTSSDIPNLDASKITSGTFADARIASATTWNNKTSINDSSTTSTTQTWSASKLYNYVDYMTASDVDTIWAEVIG